MKIEKRGFDKRLKFLFMLSLFVCVSTHTMAGYDGYENNRNLQDKGKIVSGKITGVSGRPLVGATVVVAGTTIGTITDINGNYSIMVPSENNILIFSFVGYAKEEIPVAGKSTISLHMKENVSELDDVVVTALGVKRENKALGYAITELKGKDLKGNSINPVNALQGKAAGVDVSQSDGGMFGSSRIIIRGASTLGDNNQPIYVVDGVVIDNSVADVGNADWVADAGDYGNELKNLNPDDFESVSILKGAPATALYGSRGMNGAVVVTTKSGRKSKGLGVSISQSFGVDYVYRQPDLQNVYGDGGISGYVDYGEKDSDENYYKWQNQEQFYLNTKGKEKFNTWGCGYGPRFDGREILGYDNKITTYKACKNNYRNMYNVGFNSNTNVAIQGGDGTTSFYTSISYKHAKGTLGKNEFNRLSFLAKASRKLNDNILVEASMSFANSTPKNPQPNVGEYFFKGTFSREYDPDYYKHKYKGSHGGLASSDYGDEYGSIPGRRLWWDLNENHKGQTETSVRPNFAVTVAVTNWLKVKAEANYNYYFTSREIKNPNSGYARTSEGEDNEGEYSLAQTTKKQTNANASLIFNKNLSRDIGLSGFVRGEFFENKQSYMKNSTNGGLVVPDQYFIANSIDDVSYDSYLLGHKRIVSAVASANLSWKGRLFLDITGRNDWSSSLVYSDGTGNYSYFYPSVSLSAIVGDMVDLPSWVSFGKIRLSWAQVGNDTDPYLINTAYSLDTSDEDGQNVNSLQIGDTMYSTDIKPEKKTSWEVGLDWRFVNNRVGLDVTYYKENTRNQIMNIDVPSVSGVNNQLVNAGNIQNQGIEITLHTTPIDTRNWQWDVDFTYSNNKSKIVSLHKNVADYILLDGYTTYGNYRIGSVAKVGGEYGMLVTDSKPMIDENTGLPVLYYSNSLRAARRQRSGEEEELGSVQPDFIGSMRTTVKYRNISLTAGFDMRFGGMVASYGARYGTAYGYTKASLKYSAPEYGGMTWTSGFDGITYSDGMIPNGILEGGTSIAVPDGTSYTVAEGGETYRALYEKGVVEPVHASAWHYLNNSWSSGTINDNWVKELNYISLREVSIRYDCPALAGKIGLKNLSFGLAGYNLGYLLNNAPAGVNPESVRGTNAYSFRMRSFAAYTANYMFSINVKF